MNADDMRVCRICGTKPIWLQTPVGCDIACARCDGNEVVAPSMEDAVSKWNEVQEMRE